jgi:spermidine synthase
VGARFSRALLALVFVSGAVGLVYQSLWVRELSLILGSTTYAIGTVLAAFMAGLGVGAWVLGRRVDRSPSPLRLYATLELAVGLTGLASPFVLAQGNGIYAACYARFHAAPALLDLARFLIGFGFVAAPAFLMGGTVPVAARYLVRRPNAIGRGVGLLYAINTFGAAVGALVVPFALLPLLGIRASLLACGAANLMIAGVAWAAATGARAVPASDARKAQCGAAASPRGVRGVRAAFFVSGFVGLALEVLWNRFFAIYVGSSIYSYALILSLYLLGVFVGGLVFVLLDRLNADARRVFAACLFLLVADLAVTVPLMDRIVYLQVATLGALGTGFGSYQLATIAASILVILPPTVLLGISFPAVAKAASGEVSHFGADLGFAYLVNTAGTTTGALAASFVLIPHLGVRGSIDLLAALTVIGLALALGGPLRGGGAAAVAGAACLAVSLFVLPGWDARRMHTGFSRSPDLMVGFWHDGSLERVIGNIDVSEMRDGVDATVSVAGHADQRSLFVNGKPDASTGIDMATQTLLGHLPLLLHAAPRDVLVIGMGSGVTLAAVTRHPVATVDLVEISAEVLDLSDRYFRAENRGALHDPRVTAYVEDGRNFVAFNTARTYDVIVSEPSNPWMTGAANLFTDEFFAQVRRRLRDGGILAQWFHFYSMGLDEIRSLIGTLGRHFAHVYVFALDREATGDLMVFASEAPLDFARLLTTLGGTGPAADDMRRFGFDTPDALLRSFVLSKDNMERFVGAAPLNSDDRPGIELRAPRAIFRDTVAENLAALLAASDGARLADSAGPERQAGTVMADGLRRTFSGYRIETDEPVDAAPPGRTLLAESRFEDPSGRRLVVLTAPGLRAQAGLTRLAASVTGAAPTLAGETSVDGHLALVYSAPAVGLRLVAWNCPAENRSHAAAVIPIEGAQPGADLLDMVRCHPAG